MVGRKSKPMAIKILEGERKCRINLDEPKFAPSSSIPPEWLEGYAQEHWDELAPMLQKSGVLTEGDRMNLAILCVLYAQLRFDPLDYKAMDRYLKFSTEFGMTPSSRTRIKATPEKPKDELESFLERKAE